MINLIKKPFYKSHLLRKKLSQFILSTDWLSFGNECKKFEHVFAEFQGRKYCVMVNSGSSANLALIQTLLNLNMLEKGDGVGFSAVTWSTNVMPMVELGLHPVPIDINLDTLNVSWKNIRKVLGKYPLRVVFITHALGLCDDIEEIAIECKKKGIILIEDTCESLGSKFAGKLLGDFGIASTFSFYVGHHLSTIEGGAICTDNRKLAEMLCLVRAHGWDRNLTLNQQKKIRKKHHLDSEFYSRYSFYDLGYNLRPTEIIGFLGNQQMRYLPEIFSKRLSNYVYIYNNAIKNNDKYFQISYGHMDYFSSFCVPLLCRTSKIRDELVNRLKGKVETRPLVAGNMTLQPFFLKYVHDEFELPRADVIHRQALYIGNNPDLTKKELSLIVELIK